MPISRRSLIGAAGATAALAPTVSSSQGAAMADNDKIGFAIVGLGKLSLGQLIPGLKVAKGARLAAVVSGHPDKARRVAAENGLPADAVYGYDDYDRMAKDPRIQVVYIVLPNSLHAEHTIKALKAGKHVLCEKPMATRIQDAEAMIAAAKAANRHLMIAYRCHYEPMNLDVMRRLRARSLGRVRQINTTMGRQADPSDPSDAWRLDGELSGAGALGDMGVYGISAARYLLNEEPVAVQAWAWTDPADPRFKETQDLINWQFRFPSGVIANGSTSFAYAPTMAFEAICEQGRLVADPAAFYGGNRLTVVKGGQAQPPIPAPPGDQFAREMDWMADVVRGKAPMVSPGEEGLQDMRLMQAILESAAKDGATVKTDWGYKRAVDPAVAVDPPGKA
ncbi:Gfo/Idh/MocA family protein [Caulobacter sp. LjRoot300]|uniref:Gfo/Idh/MocA family protein n=1 Tax=Caulobacter sp. LjRoot300 TaxID=3342321 RepID=UPI003ECDDED2